MLYYFLQLMEYQLREFQSFFLYIDNISSIVENDCSEGKHHWYILMIITY